MGGRRIGVRVALLAVVLVLLGTQSSAAPVPGRVHFTAVGDFGAGGNAQAVWSTINDLDSDFTQTLGDMSYGTVGAEQAWCDAVTARVGAGYPFQLLSGNHESNGQNGNINDFSACLPNQLPGAVGTYGRQYYVDVPAEDPLVRFVNISPNLPFPDGNWNYPAGSVRYNWTAAAIDGARSASIPWVVVSMHKPCITVGNYACDPGADLFNMLVAKKVDLVLSGHEHTYQRSKQLALSASCSAVLPNSYIADCVVDSDSTLVKGAGTVVGIVGTGGIGFYNVNPSDPEAPYFAATSGGNSNPTFGVLDIDATETSLQADFVRAAGGTFTDSFTITKQDGPVNQPPVATIANSCTDLACTFDGSGSTDPDGTVTGYSWNFGDGGSATGASPAHTYGAAGNYTVSLSVTDNAGASATGTKSVTVTSPGGTTYVSDQFSRTVSNGFGSAPTGGTYTYSGAATLFSVADGLGQIRTAAGSGPSVYLAGVNAPSVDVRTSLSLDKPASGSGMYLTVFGRRIPSDGLYAAKVQVASNGAVSLTLSRRNAAGTETVIQTGVTVPGTYAVGDTLNVRLQVTGSSPTTIRAKVWETGTTEPTAWQRSVTDTTAGLQGPGSVGISPYLSSSANNAPITVRVDELTVTQP